MQNTDPGHNSDAIPALAPTGGSAANDSNVISLSTGEMVTQIKRQDGYCMSHCKNILVDGHLRQLTCRECGAIVDAFQWAAKMAMEESHLLSRIDCLNREVATYEKRVTELKDEEKRIKGRIRSAKDSLLRSAGV